MKKSRKNTKRSVRKQSKKKVSKKKNTRKRVSKKRNTRKKRKTQKGGGKFKSKICKKENDIIGNLEKNRAHARNMIREIQDLYSDDNLLFKDLEKIRDVLSKGFDLDD